MNLIKLITFFMLLLVPIALADHSTSTLKHISFVPASNTTDLFILEQDADTNYNDNRVLMGVTSGGTRSRGVWRLNDTLADTIPDGVTLNTFILECQIERKNQGGQGMELIEAFPMNTTIGETTTTWNNICDVAGGDSTCYNASWNIITSIFPPSPIDEQRFNWTLNLTYAQRLMDKTNEYWNQTLFFIDSDETGTIELDSFYSSDEVTASEHCSIYINYTEAAPPGTEPVSISLINLSSEGGIGQIIFNGTALHDNKLNSSAKTNDTTPTERATTNASATCASYSSNRLNVSDSSTVLLMTMDENASDLSTFGNDGTCIDFGDVGKCNGTDGIIGNAIKFNGIDNYIDAGDDISLDLTDAMTLSLWVKVNNFFAPQAQLISRDETPAGDRNYGISVASGDFFFQLFMGGVNKQIGSSSSFFNDTWYYITATYDKDAGSNNQLLYVNGVQVASGTETGTVDNDDVNLTIGAREDVTRAFNGSIDEVSVWNKALSAGEILSHFENGLTPNMNYSLMVKQIPERECSTTGGTEQICTTVVNDTLEIGLASSFIACKDANGHENRTSTSGMFYLNITDPIAPKVELSFPLDDVFFKLGINNTNIRFNGTCTDVVDRVYNATGYIDGVHIFSNRTYINGTEFNFSSTITALGTHTWSITCIDTFNNINSSQRSFLVIGEANITVLLDGQGNTRKYEYPVRRSKNDGTVNVIPRIVNITILIDDEVTTCISIDDKINISCNLGNWSYYFNVTELKQDKILNGTKNVNMSGLSNISIQMDNTSDIIYMTLNLTGYEYLSQFPEDIEIDQDHDGKSDVVLPGKLRGQTLEVNDFIADNENRSSYNITFQAGGSATILINITSETNLENFTIEVSGSDLDADNEFNYIEHFNGTDGAVGFNETLSVKVDAPLGVFDDFTANNSKWSMDASNDFSLVYLINPNRLRFDISSNSQGSTDYNDEAADFRNSSVVEILFVHESSASCGSPSTGSGSGSVTVFITDGTSNVQVDQFLSSQSSPGSSANIQFRNITFENIKDDDTLWRYFLNNSNQGTIDISSFDFTKQIKPMFRISESKSGNCDGDAKLQLDKISWSGGWLNYSTSNGTYQGSGNLTSKVLNVTKTNISRATLTATIYEPDNTNINFYLSNTCNNTQPIFEAATSGVVHTFNTVGNEICYRCQLNSSINFTSPICRKVNVEIIPGSLTNVSADFGSDGDVDWLFNGVLNSTTSPRVVNGSLEDFNIYRTNNCLDTLTCLYPITFSAVTGGVLGIGNSNATVNINNINMNISKIVNVSLLNITFLFEKGLLELSGIDLNFIGSKNFTINVTHSVNSTLLENKDSQIVWFRYSKFNRSLPYTFTTAIVPYGIRTVNSTNVTPFGQTVKIPIINISNHAQNAFDIGLKINRTYDCLEIKALNNSNNSQIKDYGLNLTDTTQSFTGNITKGSHQGIWLFYDLYDCDPTVARSLRLEIEQESCCRNCSRCWS